MSKSGSSITYGYNADGKRISKTVNGTTYNFSYLGDQLTEMTWGSNKLHFTYDSTGPASVTYNGNRYFYLKNAQGDVTGLVNASGTQVVSYTYDPWGAPMSTDGTMASTLGAANPLRYRGYVYDTETGLYSLNSRYYNPVWGRFVNADDVNFIGADGPLAGNNLFAYCNDNPIRYADANGYSVIAAVLISATVGAITGVASQVFSDIIASPFNGGNLSSWETYVGAALGGAVGGVATLYLGANVGSAIGAGMSTLISQSLENITGTQSREGTEIMMNSLMDFTMAGILSKVLPIKDPGVTSGRNSMSAVYSSGLTKLRNGTARKMSLKVFEKGITAGLTASVHVTIFAAIRMCL